MKKLATLLLAASMVLGSFAGAQAIDFKVSGNFQQDFGISDGLTFSKHRNRNVDRKRVYGNGAGGDDTFTANQRIIFQIQIIASEQLQGQVNFDIGDFMWGKNGGTGTKSQGAYGQRAVMMGVRYAFMDWFVPNTDLRFRMGVQRLQLPSYTFSYSPVATYEGPAVNASYKFNDNISLTAFWARPLNDNSAGADAGDGNGAWSSAVSAGDMDNVDAFGLVLPLRFDGFKVSPYGMIAALGPLAYTGSTPGNVGRRTTRLAYPAYWSTRDVRAAQAETGYTTAWWVGFTGEVTAADPFRFAWEATYGSATHPNRKWLNREGFYINAMAEYKLDWGVPGLYAWYASGDDNNPKNGSERMPMLAQDVDDYPISTFGFSGSPTNANYDGQNAFHTDPTGTWGIGVRLRDVSFVENLKHTLRVNLMGGTNSASMAKYILGKKTVVGGTPGGYQTDFNAWSNGGGSGRGALYLTTLDNLVEVNLDTSYKIYENLELIVELGYMHLWLDQSRSVWGPGSGENPNLRGVSTTDAMKAAMTIFYRF